MVVVVVVVELVVVVGDETDTSPLGASMTAVTTGAGCADATNGVFCSVASAAISAPIMKIRAISNAPRVVLQRSPLRSMGVILGSGRARDR